METLPFLLVAFLTVCLMPSALALKCYECRSRNIPGYSAKECDSERIKNITCDPILNRCMKITGTIKVPGSDPIDIVLKNCSSNLLCNRDDQFSMCNLLNKTIKLMSKCNSYCCEGDLCNGAIRTSGLLTSFAAILLTVVLNFF